MLPQRRGMALVEACGLIEPRKEGAEVAVFGGIAEVLHILDADFRWRGLRLEDLHHLGDEFVKGHGARIIGAAHQVGSDIGWDEFQNFDAGVAELVAKRERVGVEGGLGGAISRRAAPWAERPARTRH